ncbi:MAG: NADH-quinone oxidoreductase subunit D-related protein [Syntrophales bacterium]
MTSQTTDSIIPAGYQTERHGRLSVFAVNPSAITKVALYLHQEKRLPLMLITATDERKEQGAFKIWYIFGVPGENRFIAPYICLADTEEFPSLAPVIHETWEYERLIQTFFGLRPVGHPHPLPLILHENWPADAFPLRKDFHWQNRPETAHGVYPFQQVAGEGIYEIPVGPIHAGIIEPGHFRFSVAGEEIVLLEPRLGYTHKGSEKLFEELPLKDKIRLSEKISGDSSFGHCLAFCQALEELGSVAAPERALQLRVIYAELERLANHLGDLGAIMLDAGFSFGGSQCSRLREMIMQINERLTGSRFLRGVNAIGGVTRDIGLETALQLVDELRKIMKDFSEIMAFAENSASLLNRLETTGALMPKIAREHGIVGIAAKALGIVNDARRDYPYATYDRLYVAETFAKTGGDVFARFMARVVEVYGSIKMIQQALAGLPAGAIKAADTEITFRKNSLALGIVEGWRGNIVYLIRTDGQGEISRVAPRDPSFLNWTLLGYAANGYIVPDFPLINKSFNLSYSGNDL